MSDHALTALAESLEPHRNGRKAVTQYIEDDLQEAIKVFGATFGV